jgi:hypothetical protein
LGYIFGSQKENYEDLLQKSKRAVIMSIDSQKETLSRCFSEVKKKNHGE